MGCTIRDSLWQWHELFHKFLDVLIIFGCLLQLFHKFLNYLFKLLVFLIKSTKHTSSKQSSSFFINYSFIKHKTQNNFFKKDFSPNPRLQNSFQLRTKHLLKLPLNGLLKFEFFENERERDVDLK